MKTKQILTVLLLLSLGTTKYHSQDKETENTCKLLEQSEENEVKVVELAQYIEQSFHEGKTDGFNEKFNIDVFLNIVTHNQDIDPKDPYTRGFLDGLNNTSKTLSNQILKEIKDGAYYNFINYHYNIPEHTYYFTFRFYSDVTGINYHDYKVCSDGENLWFNDLYIYLIGEHLSEMYQRLFLTVKPESSSLVNRKDRNKMNNVFTLSKARSYAENGEFEKAYNAISRIKGDMRKEKFILIAKSGYASRFDEDIYEQTLEEFAEIHPNHPTLYLKQIDYFILKEKFDLALEKIDKLIFETGDDFLNLLKANTYILKNDFENAESHYGYMVDNYPDLIDAYFGRMVSLSLLNDFDETLEIAKALVEKGLDKNELILFIEEKEPDGSNQLEDFVNSEVYKIWKQKS